MKRSPINKVNRKRKAKSFARAYGSQAFLRFIHRLPCWACGYAGPSPRQAAHTITGGMGRKADANTCIALCNVCHSKQHAQGWSSLSMNKESAAEAAKKTWAAWEALRGDQEADDEGRDIPADAEGTEDAGP